MPNPTVSFDDLLKLLDQLTDEQKQIARTHLDVQSVALPEATRKPRVAGLGEGSIWTSDDFDDPLPDEFWFGDET